MKALLKNKAEVDAPDIGGTTPLMEAVYAGTFLTGQRFFSNFQ